VSPKRILSGRIIMEMWILAALYQKAKAQGSAVTSESNLQQVGIISIAPLLRH